MATKKEVAASVSKPREKKDKRPKVKVEDDGGWNDSATMDRVLSASRESFERTHPELAERYRKKAPAKRYIEHSTEKIDLNDLTAFLRRNLTMELERGDLTDPNNRRIVLKLEDVEISSVNFSVVQQREYEG